MGSTILTDGEKIRGFLGKEINVPMYIQFVPGIVIEVCNSTYDVATGDLPGNINTILAKPHYTEETNIKSSFMLKSDYRYKPLLRGIAETPAKGDPVLLCTFGGVNYYLGPLNTGNNVNWNEDTLFEPEIIQKPVNRKSGYPYWNHDDNIISHQSLNFVKTAHQRMVKIPNKILDHPLGNSTDRSEHENHGDVLIEGRHGNSIRVGSRYVNPYIIFSNGRHQDNTAESIGDGSLISITRAGSISQHFGNVYETKPNNDETLTINKGDFVLSSDTLDEPNRLMSNVVKLINNVEDVNSIIYNYNKDQIFINSDRITLNSKRDDIYLSSIKDIHIGTGRHLTISTNKDFILESENTFLGNPITTGEESRDMQPLVLGNILKEILLEILDTFTKVKAITQAGPLPLVDSTNTPLELSVDLIKPIKDKIETILSQYHFIEPNDRT